jgi:hypothetical protein
MSGHTASAAVTGVMAMLAWWAPALAKDAPPRAAQATLARPDAKTAAPDEYRKAFDDSGPQPCTKGFTVTASSTHPVDGKVSYEAKNLSDGRLKTPWVEGAEGPGIGQSVSLTVTKDDLADGQSGFGGAFLISNGYNASAGIWKKNLRVKKLKVALNGKPFSIVELADTEALQLIPFELYDQSLKAKDVITFEIAEVYTDGATYQDTAISELVPMCDHPRG